MRKVIDYKKALEESRALVDYYDKENNRLREKERELQDKIYQASRENVRLKAIELAYLDQCNDIDRLEKFHGATLDVLANKRPMEFTKQARDHAIEMRTLRANCNSKMKEADKRISDMKTAMIGAMHANAVLLKDVMPSSGVFNVKSEEL